MNKDKTHYYKPSVTNEEYDKYYKKGGSYELPTEIFNDLLEQLKAYKDKEDKLREYLENHKWLENTFVDLALEPIKDILNEGGKE